MSYRHSSCWDFGGTEELLCHEAVEEFSGGHWIHGMCSPPLLGGNSGHVREEKMSVTLEQARLLISPNK